MRMPNEIRVVIVGDSSLPKMHAAVVNMAKGSQMDQLRSLNYEVVIDNHKEKITFSEVSLREGKKLDTNTLEELNNADVVLYLDDSMLNRNISALEVALFSPEDSYRHVWQVEQALKKEDLQPKRKATYIQIGDQEQLRKLFELCVSEVLHKRKNEIAPPFWPEAITHSKELTRIQLLDMLDHYIRFQVVKPMTEGLTLFSDKEQSKEILQALSRARYSCKSIDGILDYKKGNEKSLREALNTKGWVESWSKGPSKVLQKVETKIKELQSLPEEKKAKTFAPQP